MARNQSVEQQAQENSTGYGPPGGDTIFGASKAKSILNGASHDVPVNGDDKDSSDDNRSTTLFDEAFKQSKDRKPIETKIAKEYKEYGSIGTTALKNFDDWDTDKSGDLSKKELSDARSKTVEGSAERAVAEILFDNYSQATSMATAMNPILLSRLTGDFLAAPQYEEVYGNDWKFGISKRDVEAMVYTPRFDNLSPLSRGTGEIMAGSVGIGLAFTAMAAVANVVPQWRTPYAFLALGGAFISLVPAFRTIWPSNGLLDNEARKREEMVADWKYEYDTKRYSLKHNQ